MKLFTVDAFTSRPFEGNPAAVVFLEKALPDEKLQKFAFEMNLAETAYLTPSGGVGRDPWASSDTFSLRWFTPTNEVDLCGHATLASAHALIEAGNPSSEFKFDTRSGRLFAKLEDGAIILDLPSNPPSILSPQLESVVGPLVNEICGNFKIKEMRLSSKAKKLLVRLDDDVTRSQFESLRVNTSQIQDMHDGSVFKGVILTLKGENPTGGPRGLGDYDFVSRYFAPWNGIPEDPVTGSAHSVLTPYWYGQLGKKELKARQCSARGGDLALKLRDDGRINLAGKAVTIISGNISL